MHLVLWDIDGTLIRSRGGKVSTTAFVRAIREAARIERELIYPSDVAGKTDNQIALEMLTALELDDEMAQNAIQAFGVSYLREMSGDPEKLTADLRVLPGVVEALERLRDLDVCQSLLTGNLEPVARLKLACAGLDKYFAFELGAYGSDHADRTCLVPITRDRVRRATGLDAERVVVIGDTPRDIACARAGGARVVAVATGNYSREELEAHKPDAVLDDLIDTDAVESALLGYSTEKQAPIV
ncbi:MAG: haloacid dehalogenase-like hydrolase [Chloroflexi bacterium]|nr:haloacid dehalogenase-like hydrolase [Chloroflexota bacterium]